MQKDLSSFISMEIPWWRSLERLTFTRTLGLSGGVGGMEVFEIQLSWDCHFVWHQDPKVQRLMKWTWYGYMESPWNETFFSFSFPVHNPQQASTPQIFSMVLFLILWPGSAWSLHVDMDAVYMRSLQEDLYLYLYIYINYISYRFIWLTQQVCVGPKWTEPTGPKMGYSIECD